MEQTQQALEPLAYHVELRDYLKSHERELWNWFASARSQADYTENLRMELLKSTYRLDAESHPELYRGVAEAKARLNLDIPVTIYQAQNSPQPNASLYFIPGEGHVVFSGSVLTLLNAEEIKSVLGHELAHYHLWQWEQGDLHIADRLIQAVANDPRASSSHEQTARRFQLYTEIFADRGSLCVTGDDTGQVIQDLKPIWLMSPLSVSDTLPLDPDLFDVVIFDEASQIPVEEAIPAIYRSHQAIVVGDEMQLPPTTFFAGTRSEDESVMVEEDGERIEVDLDSDSFLTQSAQNLPSTLLAWHYRSRYEALISFSNAAFYGGNLFTIPDRQRAIADRPELIVNANEEGGANVDALLGRSISFHFMENGLYEDRRNSNEAAYIAQMVREILKRDTKLSIGLVAFSEAQQGEIESALSSLAETDSEFAARLETESVREENDVFCGLFVKNLENVQGDERDIIIMSVCYGHDTNGRMLMNFGPINQRGGEKRLNVIFSRAKHHMAIVSSIRHHDITNDYNDGANNLKNFLQYAEAVSKGDVATARRVLENLNPLARKALAPLNKGDAVVENLATALRGRGYEVDLNVGQSKFRCDLAVRGNSDSLYQLGILVDTDGHYANPNLLDRYLMQPSILKAFGWRFTLVLTKDWYHNPEDVLVRIEKLLQGQDIPEETDQPDEESVEPIVPAASTQTAPKIAATVPMVTEAAPDESKEPSDKPPVPPVVSNLGSARHFEFTGGSSNKFWELALSGSSFTVRFGRIGTPGQSQTKSFADEAKARCEADHLIAEKMKKGYVEK